MATHDYVIDNQSAPNFRADLNSALQAIVTQNSSATAPTVTYANMVWYDTANNQLKKRNEANSAWITLGTIDETAGTFTPSGERALSTQAQAEAGTDNTTAMTPLRTAQAISALSLSEIPVFSVGSVPVYKYRNGAAFVSSFSSSDAALGSTYDTKFSFDPIKSGSLRASVSMSRGSSYAALFRVVKNGVVVSSFSNATSTPTVYTVDFSYNALDYIELDTGLNYSFGSSGGTQSANFSDLKLLGNTSGLFRV